MIEYCPNRKCCSPNDCTLSVDGNGSAMMHSVKDFDWSLALHIFITFSYFDTVFVRLCALTYRFVAYKALKAANRR